MKPEEILHKHVDKESIDELSENVWPDIVDAMKEYALSVAREAAEEEIKTNVDAYNSIVELQSSSKGKFEDAIYVKGKEQAAMSILSRIESKLKES